MTDKDHRNVAAHVLDTAKKVVTTERGNQHGGAEDSFKMIGDLWSTYLSNTGDNQLPGNEGMRITVTAYDVAQMMTLLKIARAVHGDPLNEDNYVDASGYQSLAAAIGGVKKPEGVPTRFGAGDPKESNPPRTPAPPPPGTILPTPAKPVSEPRIVHKHVMPAAPQIVTPEKALEVDAEEAALVALRDKLETPNA